MYLNLKDSLEFLKPYILATEPSEEKVINTLIAKVDYIQIDLDSANYMSNLPAELSNSEELTKIFIGFIDLLKEAYSDYTSDTVTKKGTGYEFRLEAKDIKPLIIKFVKYTITNIDTIVEKASAKVNSMPEKDIATFAEAIHKSSLDRAELLSGLEGFRSDIKRITPEEMDRLKNDVSFDEIFKSIEGSVLSTYIEKTTDNTYNSATNLTIKYNNKMSLDIKGTSQSSKLNAFSIIKPANVTTIEGLQAIVASVLPPRVNLVKINLKTKKTTITYSNKKISNIWMPNYTLKGDTYVSLISINKVLGTKMSWDEKKKTAIVKKDGRTIELAAKKIKGYIYVKVTDLQEIGYSVWPDTKTGVINIMDFSKQSIFQ
jgi:hypothetical protein